MANQLYAKRDSASIEPHYSRHLAALAEGNLMDREATAAELAHRDQQIEVLSAHLGYIRQIYNQWNSFQITEEEFLSLIPRLVTRIPTVQSIEVNASARADEPVADWQAQVLEIVEAMLPGLNQSSMSPEEVRQLNFKVEALKN